MASDYSKRVIIVKVLGSARLLKQRRKHVERKVCNYSNGKFVGINDLTFEEPCGERTSMFCLC